MISISKSTANLKKLASWIVMGSLIALLAASCSKTQNLVTAPLPLAALMFVQASPDQLPLDLYLANGKTNAAPFGYGQNSNYFGVVAGPTPVALDVSATMKTILADTINFVKSTSYSMFLVNKTTQPQLFLLTDTISKPASGNAAIRFINLSPDAPAVDLVVRGGAALVTNRAFKGYSSFMPLAAKIGYTLEVHQAGTGTVLATLPNLNLASGFVYTIWFHGLAAGTTSADKLTVDIINNAYFL